MSYLVYVLIICLSLHSCKARQLGITQKEINTPYIGNRFIAPTKDILGNVEFSHKGLRGEGEALITFITTKTIEENISDVPDSKGYRTKVSSLQEVAQVAKKTKESTRQFRFMLGLVSHHVEETKETKEDNIVEDIVAMDYAQPHRKPPIHNKKD